MPFVEIKFDQNQLDDAKAALSYIKNGAAKACRNALNRTVTGCITDSAKAVYEEINSTQARIKKDIAFKKATLANLSSNVHSKGKKIELIEFGAKQLVQGVSFKTKRSGSTVTMHYGFLAKGKSTGNLHVLHRPSRLVGTGKPIGVPKAGFLWTFPGKWPATYRAGTRIKYGPSVPDILGKDLIFGDVSEKASIRLAKNLAHETDFLIAQNQPEGDGSDTPSL
jgi:hypothetical protein